MDQPIITRRKAIVAAGALGATAALTGVRSVQAASSAGGDAIVGAWMGTATLSGLPSFGTLLSFAAGGSLVHSASVDLQSSQLSTPSYGAWKRVDAGNYAIKFFFFTFDAQTNPSGSGQVTEKLTVDGDNLHGTVAVTLYDTTGNVVFTVSGTIKAQRIEAD